ncbi:ABZJ_00895 family protein [Variovorax sp. KK3]|uniref:ABZJ_00895 family protein n=1 Tax=Variovorax sp. KK3 TaxID=1855728 RepID=UPI00097BCDAC|nr:ABZJ_00895 family protein [Variovorax sp. KK3]
MSLRQLLLRFGIAYLLLLLAAGALLAALGVQNNAGVNVAALLGAVMWACVGFAKKNGRYFTRPEKRRAVLGMLAVDLGIQALFSIIVSASQGTLPVAALALALLFIGALHALVIWVFVGLAGRQFARTQPPV